MAVGSQRERSFSNDGSSLWECIVAAWLPEQQKENMSESFIEKLFYILLFACILLIAMGKCLG